MSYQLTHYQVAGHDVISPVAKCNLSTFIDVMCLSTLTRASISWNHEKKYLFFSFPWSSWEFNLCVQSNVVLSSPVQMWKMKFALRILSHSGFRMRGYSQLRRGAIKTSRETISFNDLPCSETWRPLLCRNMSDTDVIENYNWLLMCSALSSDAPCIKYKILEV